MSGYWNFYVKLLKKKNILLSGLLLYFCYGMKNSIVSFPKSRATSSDGSSRRIDNSNTSDQANR